MNKLFARVLLLSTLAVSSFAQPVSVGMPEADLLKSRGAPLSKALLGKKAIYRWPDVQVTILSGKVESFQRRNIVAEKEDAKERARAEARRKSDAAAKARETVLDSREATVYSRLDNAATTREREERLLRAASIQQQIRSIETQLSADDKRSSFKGSPPMSAEARAFLNLRLDNLRSELASLR